MSEDYRHVLRRQVLNCSLTHAENDIVVITGSYGTLEDYDGQCEVLWLCRAIAAIKPVHPVPSVDSSIVKARRVNDIKALRLD